MRVKRLVVGDLDANCYIISLEDGACIIIDPGADGDLIVRSIEDNELEPISIVLTHSHYDHIAAAPAIRERYGIPILIHESDADSLADSKSNFSAVFDEPIAFRADKTISDGDIVELGGEKMTVLHTPGHSPGSICIRANDFLISGDTIFREGIGRTDLPGGDYAQLTSSIRRILELPDQTTLHPGHGPRTTIGAERPSLEGILQQNP